MENKIDLEIMEIKDLKALAYDHLANIENSQRVLQAISAEIRKKAQADVIGSTASVATGDIPSL